jgi:hypothetical protein
MITKSVRALDRRRTSDRLDCWFRPAIGQAERKLAEGRISLKRSTDLLEELVEGGVPDRPVALLDVDLDLDRMLIVGIPEAAERLLGLARITVAQDDQAAAWYLLGQHAVALDDGIGNRLEQRPERAQNLLGLARRHRSFRPQLLLDHHRQLR